MLTIPRKKETLSAYDNQNLNSERRLSIIPLDGGRMCTNFGTIMINLWNTEFGTFT